MSLPDKLRRLSALLFRRLPDDPVALALLAHFGAAARGSDGASRVVAIQCVEDPFYLGLFTVLSRCLAARPAASGGIAFDLVAQRSFNAGLGSGWASFFLRTLALSRLIDRQWFGVYRTVSQRLGYRSTSPDPIGDAIDLRSTWRAWRATVAAGRLEGLHIDGVACGDLIIDSYLRFRPSPRLQPSDPFVLYLIWQAHRDVRRATRYFRRARPLLYLTSYTTYIQHGVAARVALREGVRVVSFGNLQEFGKVLSAGDSFHTRNPVGYRREFELLPNRTELLRDAERQLEIRLSGGVDSATSYMAASAYRATTTEVPEVRGAVVVFLHDFYDSPHVYADLVFPDFWAWICFTIETLRSAGTPFFVKPHPNQIALSGSVIDELRQAFPELRFIAPTVTNRQLVDASMACAVTVYGTVAHEMAYLGVPSIACARHPHIAFDFCHTARDRDAYAALLWQALRLGDDPGTMRAQALQFYVMHNLSLPPAQIALRDAFIDAWKACHDAAVAPAAVVESFDRLATLPGLPAFADAMIAGAPFPQAMK